MSRRTEQTSRGTFKYRCRVTASVVFVVLLWTLCCASAVKAAPITLAQPITVNNVFFPQYFDTGSYTQRALVDLAAQLARGDQFGENSERIRLILAAIANGDVYDGLNSSISRDAVSQPDLSPSSRQRSRHGSDLQRARHNSDFRVPNPASSPGIGRGATLLSQSARSLSCPQPPSPHGHINSTHSEDYPWSRSTPQPIMRSTTSAPPQFGFSPLTAGIRLSSDPQLAPFAHPSASPQFGAGSQFAGSSRSSASPQFAVGPLSPATPHFAPPLQLASSPMLAHTPPERPIFRTYSMASEHGQEHDSNWSPSN